MPPKGQNSPGEIRSQFAAATYCQRQKLVFVEVPKDGQDACAPVLGREPIDVGDVVEDAIDRETALPIERR